MKDADAATPLRREAIKIIQNKREDFDYIVARHDVVPIRSVTGLTTKEANIHIHFVPGRYLLAPIDGLTSYFEKSGNEAWDSPEEFAQAIVDDLNNELVPRWLRLQVRFGDGHELLFEDRQPKWRNDGLLAQLLIST
jgi:7-cyano-7-deazaguanine reductase